MNSPDVWSIALTIAASVSAAVAVVSWLAVRRSAGAAETSAETAATALEESRRACVIATVGEDTVHGVVMPQMVLLTNLGKAPAFGIRAQLTVSSANGPDTQECPQTEEYPHNLDYLAPGQRQVVGTVPVNFARSVWGNVTFVDAEGEHTWHRDDGGQWEELVHAGSGEENERMSVRGRRAGRDAKQEPQGAGLPRVYWLGLLISALALAVLSGTLAFTLYEAREATRAKWEEADYLSYRLGVDLGLYKVGCPDKDVPSPALPVAHPDYWLRNTVQARAETLGLDLEIPDPLPLDRKLMHRLIMQAHMLVRDSGGQRAVDHYVLGVNIGQAQGYLAPSIRPAEVEAREASDPPVDLPVPQEHSKALAALITHINEQLGKLGFQHRVELDQQSAVTSYDRLNDLDRTIIGDYDPRDRRWLRPTQNVSAEEASE